MRARTKDWVIPTITGIASFGIGIGVGYIYAKRTLLKDDSKIEDLESQITQVVFMQEERDRKFDSQLQQFSQLIKQLKNDGTEFLGNYAAHTEELPEDRHPSNGRIILAPVANRDDDSLVVNVFSDEDDDWDYEEEEQTRNPDHPYVIHRDEYDQNEDDYGQSTLTYYAGDNILCDEHDVPVYDPERVVGALQFGHGSKDPSICFIRNDRLLAEYEVLFDPGSFQEEVLGQDPRDLKHHRVPKFRPE